MIQHKNEAKTFYRFLSIVYDHIVNPGHWTIDMRTDALQPAKLNDPSLKVAPQHRHRGTRNPPTAHITVHDNAVPEPGQSAIAVTQAIY